MSDDGLRHNNYVRGYDMVIIRPLEMLCAYQLVTRCRRRLSLGVPTVELRRRLRRYRHHLRVHLPSLHALLLRADGEDVATRTNAILQGLLEHARVRHAHHVHRRHRHVRHEEDIRHGRHDGAEGEPVRYVVVVVVVVVIVGDRCHRGCYRCSWYIYR